MRFLWDFHLIIQTYFPSVSYETETEPINPNQNNHHHPLRYVLHIHSVIFIACMFHCQSKAKENEKQHYCFSTHQPKSLSGAAVAQYNPFLIQLRALLLRPEATPSSSTTTTTTSLSNSNFQRGYPENSICCCCCINH